MAPDRRNGAHRPATGEGAPAMKYTVLWRCRLLLLRPNLYQLNQHFYSRGHFLQAGPLQRRMRIVFARRKIRRRQTALRELRAVRAASNRRQLAFASQAAECLLSV